MHISWFSVHTVNRLKRHMIRQKLSIFYGVQKQQMNAINSVSDTHLHTGGVSMRVCSQSRCTLTVTHSIWLQIDNPRKHYATPEHYVICHHNKKLGQVIEILADEQIHMGPLIHLTWLASKKAQDVCFSPSWYVFAGSWFVGCVSGVQDGAVFFRLRR